MEDLSEVEITPKVFNIEIFAIPQIFEKALTLLESK